MCDKETTQMPTNLGIDDHLLKQAQRAGGHRTKKATVNEALAEYVLRRKQQKILKLFGRVDYDPTYNHKTGRKNR
jgi:Arc/MetJ family transcription regulator